MGQYEIWNAYVSWHAGCNYSPLTRKNKNSTERQSPIYVLPLPKFTISQTDFSSTVISKRVRRK